MRTFLLLFGALSVCDTLISLRYTRLNAGTAFPAMLGGAALLLVALYGVLSPVLELPAVQGLVVFICALPIIIIVVMCAVTHIGLASSKKPTDGADAVIVLGYFTKNGIMPEALRKRVDAAFRYLGENSRAAVILSGGVDKGETVSEAAIMRAYLLGLGVDPARVIVEDSSRSTEENFVFSEKLARERFGGDPRLVFITTTYHVPRAEKTARKLGLDIPGIGADGIWFTTPNDYLREFFVFVKLRREGKL